MRTRHRANPAPASSEPESEGSEMEEDAEEEGGQLQTSEDEAGSRGKRARAAEPRQPSKLARASAPAEGLCGATAALLDILSLPSVQQCLETPQKPAPAAARQIATLATALGSPGNIGVASLLLSLWGTLETPPEPWQADLPRTLQGFDPDSGAVRLPALKALCRALHLPVTGNKAALADRLRGLLPLLPQRVPLLAALAAQPEIARKVKARSALAALEEEPEVAVEGFFGGKVSATKAKSEWCLGDADLKVRSGGCSGFIAADWEGSRSSPLLCTPTGPAFLLPAAGPPLLHLHEPDLPGRAAHAAVPPEGHQARRPPAVRIPGGHRGRQEEERSARQVDTVEQGREEDCAQAGGSHSVRT